MLTRISVATLTTYALLLSLAALAKTKDNADPGLERVACEGVYGKDVTLERIVEHFGAENVEARTEVDMVEGQPVMGTKVYGSDPDRTIVYQWFDEEYSQYVAYIGLPPTLATPGGLHVGQTAAEVEKLNGQRFGMSGFWWDYGGYPFLHEGGDLWDEEADCIPMIRFAPSIEADFDVAPISGDKTVYSDNPLLAKVGVKVQEAGMGYEFPAGYDGFGDGDAVDE